jgi:hypothetical protein
MAERSSRSVGEIEREIEAARQDLVVTVEELELAVRERMEWRTWIRRKPLAFAGGALVLGLLIGLR